MENLKKHKGAFIAAGIIIIILAALFWWGGNAPGMRGWTVGEPFPQKRTEKQMKKRNKNKIKKSKVD